LAIGSLSMSPNFSGAPSGNGHVLLVMVTLMGKSIFHFACAYTVGRRSVYASKSWTFRPPSPLRRCASQFACRCCDGEWVTRVVMSSRGSRHPRNQHDFPWPSRFPADTRYAIFKAFTDPPPPSTKLPSARRKAKNPICAKSRPAKWN
jgi:hypothetical protein